MEKLFKTLGFLMCLISIIAHSAGYPTIDAIYSMLCGIFIIITNDK